ncbi:MAG: hypothetical protein RSC04_02350, partial [Bacteroidales bacterium]
MKNIFLSLLLIGGFFKIFGQEAPIATLNTNLAVGDTARFIMRAVDNGTIKIDFGDGKPIEVLLGAYRSFPQGAVGESKTIKIYGSPSLIDVFSIYNAKITNIDVSKLSELKCLGLGKNSLSQLDLSQNFTLEELIIYANKFTQIDISILPELKLFNCAGNSITDLDFSANKKIQTLYCGSNKLSKIEVSMIDSLKILECQSNEIEVLNISKNTYLVQLCCDRNKLTRLDISQNKNLRYFTCTNNYLVFGTLPLFKPVIATSYIYAPQKDFQLPDTTGYVDFSEGYEIEGFKTNYIWRTSAGKTLIKGIDYEINNGITLFKKKGLEVFCELSNEAFPLLSGEYLLKTSNTITKLHNVSNEMDAYLENIGMYTDLKQIFVLCPLGSKIVVY